MSSLLSVLATKDPLQAQICLFKTDPREARTFVKEHSTSSSAFIETIADIDNAHFITMYEMQNIVERLYATHFTRPPSDRLKAAKELAKALSEKQKELPKLNTVVINPTGLKFCPPSGVIKPAKAGTKVAIFIELVARGTTVAELAAAVGWKESAVISGFNWDLNKCRGFGYTVEKKNGVDFYRLIVPEWYKGPLIK